MSSERGRWGYGATSSDRKWEFKVLAISRSDLIARLEHEDACGWDVIGFVADGDGKFTILLRRSLVNEQEPGWETLSG